MKAQYKIRILLTLLLASTVGAVVSSSKTQPVVPEAVRQIPGPTSSWRPRKEVKGALFVGSGVCIECHKNFSGPQHDTVMAKALALPAHCEILASHKELTFQSGPYLYRILRQGDGSLYSVADKTETISEPILYCFGQGKAGQTYLFKHKGSFYESRISFFKEIDGLDYTIGHSRFASPTLAEAAGRVISAEEARDCFSCHATGAVSDGRLQLERLIPGVSCEACHGPGQKHVRAMKSQAFKDSYIFDPTKLDADQLAQEFCGACHRSVDEVSRMPKLGGGVHNVRFQPYRLFNSPGHDPTDRRLSCTVCHDPHENVRRDAAFYDDKCLACHQSTGANQKATLTSPSPEERKAKPCPESNQLCVTCHMPRVEIPGSHFKFTDHRIRISHPGDSYPN